MFSLRKVDLEGVLGFLSDVGELDFDEPYPVAVLDRLKDLVPCDEITYQECDVDEKHFLTMVYIGPDGDDDDNELYWAVGPCPITDHRIRTGDLSAVRISDLVDRRRYQEQPVFREYFRPAGVEHMIDVGLPAAAGRHRSFILFRYAGTGDFSERDRAVLDMLRPHFHGLEDRAALRRRLSERPPAREVDAGSGAYTGLTPREREIVVLVADGKTNAQIAAQLWVAPSTVKKHLEHVYEKLGVGRRTAAATRMHASR
jgi:DNA-binding CsgD family transcriptional regulator